MPNEFSKTIAVLKFAPQGLCLFIQRSNFKMLTLIQEWFMNCVMVILSVGSVFNSWQMSCFAVK